MPPGPLLARGLGLPWKGQAKRIVQTFQIGYGMVWVRPSVQVTVTPAVLDATVQSEPSLRVTVVPSGQISRIVVVVPTWSVQSAPFVPLVPLAPLTPSRPGCPSTPRWPLLPGVIVAEKPSLQERMAEPSGFCATLQERGSPQAEMSSGRISDALIRPCLLTDRTQYVRLRC
jgi:hypothetical protein